jgi:serine/threonine protein kinase
MSPTQDFPQRPSDVLGDREPVEVGRYRLLEQLGAGGMGTVYKALDPQLDRVVALKLPRFDGPPHTHAMREQRFYREARAAASVRHPHVCPIYDVGEHDGHPYVVMAYIDGETLAKRLSNQQSPQPAEQVITLVRQVLDALEAIHAHGIIHRDLKPANILLDSNACAVVADFGLARSLESEAFTSEGVVVGTPSYMAPEQALGRVQEIGPWTDLYAVGVILYQMVTGRLPFEGPAVAVLARIAHETPPPLSSLRLGLNPLLEAIILKALARQPRDRYQNAREFGEALARLSATSDLPTMTCDSPRANSQVEPSSATLPEHGHSANERAPERIATVEYPQVGRLPSLRRWVREMSLPMKMISVALILVGIMGLINYRALFPGASRDGRDMNPHVTRENYDKIMPDMTAWEVDEVLGSGGKGRLLDSLGQYAEVWRPGDQKVVFEKGIPREFRQEVLWRSGAKAIFVSFLNNRVVAKREEGLDRE